ncbi:MAG TPA: VOC family protein [Pirellulales bacterium]|nr:VOC family protein [Pirellulales bacterium]
MSEKSRFNNLGLGLLVIRSNDMEKAAAFYAALGLNLVKHLHPPCGDHYSTTTAGCVFEICQRRENQAATTPAVFGFHVSCVELAVEIAISNGGKLKHAPESSEWGTTAVVADLDGHSVLLIEKE